MARPDITELGESLLSGKIERVRRQEKRAEKDQRKALLMGLGLQLGAGAVQSFFNKKISNFAQNEDVLKSKIQVNNAYAKAAQMEQIITAQKGQNLEDYWRQEGWSQWEAANKGALAEGRHESYFAAMREAAREDIEEYARNKAQLQRKAQAALRDVVSPTDFKEITAAYTPQRRGIIENLFNAVLGKTGMDEKAAAAKITSLTGMPANVALQAVDRFEQHGNLDKALRDADDIVLTPKERTIDVKESVNQGTGAKQISKTIEKISSDGKVTQSTKIVVDDVTKMSKKEQLEALKVSNAMRAKILPNLTEDGRKLLLEAEENLGVDPRSPSNLTYENQIKLMNIYAKVLSTHNNFMQPVDQAVLESIASSYIRSKFTGLDAELGDVNVLDVYNSADVLVDHVLSQSGISQSREPQTFQYGQGRGN